MYGKPPYREYSLYPKYESLEYTDMNSANERGWILISSPLPLNSVRMSDDRNFELLPVM